MSGKEESYLTEIKLKKYLISWSLMLDSHELQTISKQPQVLKKGLDYVKYLTSENKINIYRIIPFEEITKFDGRGVSSNVSEPVHPKGIAIVDASSLDEARAMIDNWLQGLQYGGIPIHKYLNYEIIPLTEIGF